MMFNSIALEQQSITPSKVVCIGRNYLKHIQELNNAIPEQMVVFIKPNSAISESLFAHRQETLHYEAEICFLVKSSKLYAIGFGLDLTKRALQSQLKSKSLPWERAKAFDASALFSTFVNIEDIDIDNADINLTLKINGKVKQRANIQTMMIKPQQILKELQTFMSLQDGDIIMTGTPEGVGEIHVGDIFEGDIQDKDKLLCNAQWVAQ